MRRVSNIALAVAAATALAASIAVFAHDRNTRVAPNAFANKYTFKQRRPEIIDSITLAATGAEAADLIADTAIRDAVEPVSLAGVDNEVRNAWLDLVPRTDGELKDASGLMLEAIKTNPGWPYHEALLGETVYTRHSRNLSPELVTKYEQWRIPLLAGAEAANVDDNLWQSLAVGYIQTWPDLGRIHVKTSRMVFHRAFEDPEFVTETFSLAIQTIGKQRAVAAVPDRAKPLWQAMQQLGKSGDVLTAWSVHQRWDAAEWRERGEDLAAIEKQSARGDLDEERRLCQLWTSAHSVWDYDSPAAHKQAARLLELWPAGTEGQWRSDPRADIVRYFLGGRTADVNGAVLARTIDSIAGVPLPTVARIRVLAGDIAGAESIVRSAEGFGSLEWTPYVLELTRYWIGQKEKAKARAAFAQLAPAAREECDAAIVGAAAGEIVPPASLSGTSRIWIDKTAIALCTPRSSQPALTLTLLGGSPAVIDYGVDAARSGSMLLSASQRPVVADLVTTAGMRTIDANVVLASTPAPSIALDLRP